MLCNFPRMPILQIREKGRIFHLVMNWDIIFYLRFKKYFFHSEAYLVFCKWSCTFRIENVWSADPKLIHWFFMACPVPVMCKYYGYGHIHMRKIHACLLYSWLNSDSSEICIALNKNVGVLLLWAHENNLGCIFLEGHWFWLLEYYTAWCGSKVEWSCIDETAL